MRTQLMVLAAVGLWACQGKTIQVSDNDEPDANSPGTGGADGHIGAGGSSPWGSHVGVGGVVEGTGGFVYAEAGGSQVGGSIDLGAGGSQVMPGAGGVAVMPGAGGVMVTPGAGGSSAGGMTAQGGIEAGGSTYAQTGGSGWGRGGYMGTGGVPSSYGVGGVSTPSAPYVEPDTAGCVAGSDASTIVGSWAANDLPQSTGQTSALLIISGASETHGVCGTITFGTDPAPAPPTDPNVGWPTADDAGVTPNPWGIVPGYAYPIFSEGVAATRIQFSFDRNSPWKHWCEIQTPVSDGYGHYHCAPGSVAWWDNGNGCFVDGVSIDCSKAELCSRYDLCGCNVSSCYLVEGSRSSFDLTMGTTRAIGDFDGSSIQLQRVVNDH